MLFHSAEYAFFILATFSIYWIVLGCTLRIQNAFLLLTSYVFYATWDWRFLSLLLFLSLCNFFIAIKIEGSHRSDKKWFLFGLVLNIGVLFVFKYFNFFIQSFFSFISILGISISISTLKIILPVGISCYTFLSISYIVDVYKRKIHSEKNIITLLLSLSFFPIILSGPIQRPTSLISQINNRRNFTYNQITDGLRQILWGIFVKLIIADNLGLYVDQVFSNSKNLNGITLLFGAILYSIQIYADFSGYSDIAIGSAKLFGFQLSRNFAYPYFSRNITVFWKRWHMTLTSWFRDYVFMPIAYWVSNKIKTEKILIFKTDLIIYIIGISITWFLTGLWHGANYTFIVWGGIHGFLLVLYMWQKKAKKKFLKALKIKNSNRLLILFESVFTFILVTFAWIFFRAESLSHAVQICNKICSSSLFSSLEIIPQNTLIFIPIFLLADWLQRNKEHTLQFNIRLGIGAKSFRWALYCIILLVIFLFGNFSSNYEFIYFQF